MYILKYQVPDLKNNALYFHVSVFMIQWYWQKLLEKMNWDTIIKINQISNKITNRKHFQASIFINIGMRLVLFIAIVKKERLNDPLSKVSFIVIWKENIGVAYIEKVYFQAFLKTITAQWLSNSFVEKIWIILAN